MGLDRTVGYLGPPGSHSHQAATLLQARLHAVGVEVASLAPFGSLPGLMQAAEEGRVGLAVLPVENLLEGSVSEVIQGLGLGRFALQPLAEFCVPVRHCLLVSDDATPVGRVVSHPQALGQCRETLLARYGEGLVLQATASTSEAARLLAEGALEPGSAVIASSMAASLYGLRIEHAALSDVPDNVTRFWLVQSPVHPFPSLNLEALPKKTSLCLAFPDRPGGLLEVLQVFQAAHINLTRIESRPSRKRLGEYVFYLDAAASLPDFSDVLPCLQALTTYCNVLGPYACLGELAD